MSTEFAIKEVMPGKLNALVKNIMRQTGAIDPNEAVRLVNSGEWVVSKQTRNWWGQDGVIYFSVTSDGTTGEDWINRLEDNGFRMSDYAKQMLRCPDFKPTSGVKTEVAVLRGVLFENKDRVTRKIRAEADKRKLSKPNAELACLIRAKFTDEEIEAMDLEYIVAMHEPINDSVGDPRLLSADRYGTGRWLSAFCVRHGDRWHRVHGFAFACRTSVLNTKTLV